MYPAPEDADKRERRQAGYRAAVTCMDAAIGEMLDLLDEFEVADRTLVIFFSDNGGSGLADNGPLKGGKAQMFEGGLRVPCVVRFPGRIPPGTVCTQFLTSLEVFPTVLRLAGLEPPPGVVLDGFDMMPVLEGKAKSPRREMFWQRRADRAARVDNWKWVESQRGRGLFDLGQDIGEQHNLWSEKPEVLAMMKDRFAAWKKQMDEAEPRGPFRDY
jgi:arylsulfatase A-like enzyme